MYDTRKPADDIPVEPSSLWILIRLPLEICALFWEAFFYPEKRRGGPRSNPEPYGGSGRNASRNIYEVGPNTPRGGSRYSKPR